jgi:hypothetical protein
MSLGSAGAGRVQILKRVDAKGMIDQRTNAVGRSLRCGKRGDAGDPVTHGCAPDGFFVIEGLAAEGRINDQIDATGFDQIDDVGATFVSLIDGFGSYTRRGERSGGAASGQQSESQFGEIACQRHNMALIVIIDADKDRALAGQLLSSGKLRFGERLAETGRHAHDFSSGTHFGAKNRVYAAEFVKRKYGRLDGVIVADAKLLYTVRLDQRQIHARKFSSCHQASGHFRERCEKRED